MENTVEESTVGYISVSMISVIGGKSELGKGTSVNLSTKRHYFGYLVQNDFFGVICLIKIHLHDSKSTKR